jgi:hypothetical protein
MTLNAKPECVVNPWLGMLWLRTAVMPRDRNRNYVLQQQKVTFLVHVIIGIAFVVFANFMSWVLLVKQPVAKLLKNFPKLYDSKVYYRVHKRPPMVPILSDTSISVLSFLLLLDEHRGVFRWDFPTKLLYPFLLLINSHACCTHTIPISSSFTS